MILKAMNFIEQFYLILNNHEVKSRVSFLLDRGKKDTRFIDYFGVNYDDEKITSVKLYFSFFDEIPYDALDYIGIDKSVLSLIEQCWSPVEKYEYFHQGLTLALKCYVKDEDIQINPYFHFRSEKLPFISPKHIQLTSVDKQNPFGICVEQHSGKVELKNYYYLSDKKSIASIWPIFSENNSFLDKISLIEYTEGEKTNKINTIFSNSGVTMKYLLGQLKINEFNLFLYEKHQLYFFAPGLRQNSEIKALYFLPKKALYDLCKINTIKKLLNS